MRICSSCSSWQTEALVQQFPASSSRRRADRRRTSISVVIRATANTDFRISYNFLLGGRGQHVLFLFSRMLRFTLPALLMPHSFLSSRHYPGDVPIRQVRCTWPGRIGVNFSSCRERPVFSRMQRFTLRALVMPNSFLSSRHSLGDVPIRQGRCVRPGRAGIKSNSCSDKASLLFRVQRVHKPLHDIVSCVDVV